MPGVLPPVGEQQFITKTTRRSIQEMFASALDQRIQILSVTASSTLIKITTNGVHGLSNGDKVIIAGVTGTTEANGYWTITSTGSNEFTLDGSVHTNAHTGGGYIYDGVSYAVLCSLSPASPGILVVADIKQVSGGAVVDVEQTVKQITSTTETEFMRSEIGSPQAIALLTLTNNSAGSITGSIRIRSTKGYGNIVQPRIPFTLAAGHSLVVGGDGNRSKYDASGIPVVS